MTAASLDNTGLIVLTGSSANQALLDVTTGVAGFGTAGVLSGRVQLSGDSAIEFKSGQITSLAASAQLLLSGNDAFIEDSTAQGSNSALTGLASIGADSGLGLGDGAAVSTTHALVNNGDVSIGGGGSSLTVGGTLTNSGSLTIGDNAKVTAAALDNIGQIGLRGSSTKQALLDVTTGVAGFGAAGVLRGSVVLTPDSAIEFASGQISTIAASSYLQLIGNSAFIEDSTALGWNSALTGLSDIAGELDLDSWGAVGASLSTTGALVNDGLVNLDNNEDGGGGSSLTVAETLTNTGTLFVGSNGLPSSDSVTATSFVNSGTVDLTGYRTNFAALDVSGTTTNNGTISIDQDTEQLAGAVGGAGSFSLSNANLRFELERFGRADHQGDRRGRAHAQ